MEKTQAASTPASPRRRVDGDTVRYMAWMWWLSAPVVLSILGAAVVGLRTRHLTPAPPRDADESIAAHSALLEALGAGRASGPVPVTVLVTDGGHDVEPTVVSAVVTEHGSAA